MIWVFTGVVWVFGTLGGWVFGFSLVGFWWLVG